MSDHQQPTTIRQPNRNIPMLLGGVVGIDGCSSKEITEHSSGFIEGNFVLAQISNRFVRIPLKLHAPSVAGLDLVFRTWATQASSNFASATIRHLAKETAMPRSVSFLAQLTGLSIAWRSKATPLRLS
jgi:hypothetical protein